MKYKKIILAGGNGYMGGVFADHYKDLAEEIIILSSSLKHLTGISVRSYGMERMKEIGLRS
jgi:hypothetical protein